jgi:histidinol-phosphate/aromatic aminotransferase/cobyric acid decarboxylase-like protein/choline kinase
MGKRLKQLTQNNTKCMVKVNGVPLINRTLSQLEKHNLSRIVIVVGYEGENLKEHISTLHVSTPIVYVENPIYDKTNNIYSLFLAKDYLLMEDTLLLESDIIFEDAVLDSLTEDPRDSLALVAKYESWMDGTCVRLSEQDEIEEMIPGSKFRFADISSYYKTVNLYKFSREFSRTHYVPFLEAYTKALGNNEYYEQVLKVLVSLDNPGIRGKRLDPALRWYEIDDIQDLDIAESMFADEEEKVGLIQRRYGGYWRYPKMLDFCYLVNCYYPPKKMLDEMKANFDVLACQYPSGMYVNSLLAARNFSLRQEQIVVGNGAAELIKALMEQLGGTLGVIRPTFEEYPNRREKEAVVTYLPETEDFSYSADDVIRFFEDKGISNLLLVNPDNPTGNYIPKEGLLKLIAWTKEKGITFLADESFVDFSDEAEPTLLKEELLDENPHLIVVKSISKSYGIPGLRLGVAASGDKELINRLKKDVAIWNINSLGEFYMQIEEKYRKNYTASLAALRSERSRFAEALRDVPHLRVFPSQANYLMAELSDGFTAAQLTERLLNGYNILVKDLSSKIKKEGRQFLRIAVRTEADDDALVRALKELLK